MKKISTIQGFTLIELLIAMAIASIVMAAIVTTFTIQVRGKNTQEALTHMNQTARAALEVMSHEIRMSGCDPEETGDTGILKATVSELIFSMDTQNDDCENVADGDICDRSEVIRYKLTNDSDDDGENDDISSGVRCDLGRETGAQIIPDETSGTVSCSGGGTCYEPGRTALQPLGRHVDALNFVYLDEDGNTITTPVSAGNLDDIRTIEVAIVARAGESSGGLLHSYTNTETYENIQGATILGAQNDSFRRLGLSTTIFLRNMGR